jgi:hydrogenase assembly chaperone HypC/HupF
MCLAVPAKVVEEKGGKAVIEQFGQARLVFNNVVNARVGEFVLVQQGFIVEVLEEAEARKALEEIENAEA